MVRSDMVPPAPEERITDVCYTDLGDRVKISVRTDKKCRAFAILGGQGYWEEGNLTEPYHFKDHIFLFSKKALAHFGAFSVVFRLTTSAGLDSPFGERWEAKIKWDPGDLVSESDRICAMDRGLVRKSTAPRPMPEGAHFVTERYETRDGKPVVVHVFSYDPRRFSTVCGTSSAGYASSGAIASVMQSALAEEQKGRRVLAAFNADFFDMYASNAPAGLCVKDGKIVAHADSARPFFGVDTEGKVMIDALPGKWNLLPRLTQAVGGFPLLVDQGRILEENLGAGERFGEAPHPRTLVGLTEEGRVVLMQIDGRREWHSCGATLLDAAILLREKGVVRGLNLDGGGSSTCILRVDGSLTMLNHPASLKEPHIDKVRNVFNSLLILE